MKICAAQTKPVAGNIQINIQNHKRLISLAVRDKTDLIIFPELSITGYEPRLAEDLATWPNDERFSIFQTLSNAHQVTIAIGLPLRSNSGVLISMMFFQPHKSRKIYSKQHLHQDELPFFVSGQEQVLLRIEEAKVAPAICYELSVPQHSETVFQMGAEIYVASVAKSVDGVKMATETLSGIARKYSMTVLMSNCVGLCDGVQCAGQTSIWNSNGVLEAQLDDRNEGILIIDTGTHQVIKKTI
jgi:predicted amidohydrolase